MKGHRYAWILCANRLGRDHTGSSARDAPRVDGRTPDPNLEWPRLDPLPQDTGGDHDLSPLGPGARRHASASGQAGVEAHRVTMTPRGPRASDFADSATSFHVVTVPCPASTL